MRLTRYLKGSRSLGLEIHHPTGAKPGTIVLDMFSDSDFAGCLETRRAVTCGIFALDGQCIYGFSRRQGVQSTSGAEAELYAASSVCFDGRLLKHICEWLGYNVEYRLLL